MKYKFFTVLLLTSVVVIGCQKEPKVLIDEEEHEEVAAVHQKEANQLEVSLENSDGESVGTIDLIEKDDGVLLHVQVVNLPPGLHGFHIHEKGRCEGPTFETAGGHFNPSHKKHGFDHPDGPHDGDIENLDVQTDGTANVQFINDRVTLKKGEKNSLFSDDGTSFVIHAQPDDYKTQPAGNSGERIACGIIFEGKNT